MITAFLLAASLILPAQTDTATTVETIYVVECMGLRLGRTPPHGTTTKQCNHLLDGSTE
ncbi:MAG: hypothetical protein GY747_11250 [Planctomycetes bacterium]|nr:hypothetical protein [Planctomycetota bacterium]MCP4772207.1 hypothetical protein [Planctomycetota bacterium]MCP4861263.1 hypothetical protein [Planctomycetota bacterium]